MLPSKRACRNRQVPDQPVKQMAKAAVNILLERIESPDLLPEKRVLAGEFIRGSSALI